MSPARYQGPADCAKRFESAAPCLQGSECVGSRLQSSFLNSHIYSPPNPPSGPAHSAGHPYACALGGFFLCFFLTSFFMLKKTVPGAKNRRKCAQQLPNGSQNGAKSCPRTSFFCFWPTLVFVQQYSVLARF